MRNTRSNSYPIALVILFLSANAAACATTSTIATKAEAPQTSPDGWFSWRGPNQNGVSAEKALPIDLSPDGPRLLWSAPLSGGGAPVTHGDRVCTFGYRGAGADLEEVLSCRNRGSGEILWEHSFNDFLSDIIYERYGIGSPTIDPGTGNTYLMTSNGVIAAFSEAGAPLWKRSMMEEFGRLTFPNGRTGSPVIVDDLVIVRGIVTSWGRLGPARDRFYAFHKVRGDLVWISTPGVGPQDSSFSTPVVGIYGGAKVLYAGTGCGNIVCFRASDGKPIWRYQLARGGVNSSILLDGQRVIAIHGKENLDSSQTGRMVALQAPNDLPTDKLSVLNVEREVWRSHLGHFTSSGVLVKGRIYQMLPTGELVAVDAASGHILWRKKLGSEQLHASPLYADGKLYIPLRDGHVFVLKPSDDGAEVLSSAQLKGSCLGAPTAYGGQIFIQTTHALYAFGEPAQPLSRMAASTEPSSQVTGPASKLRIIPAETFLQAGGSTALSVWEVNNAGLPIRELPPEAWGIRKDSEQAPSLTKDNAGHLRASPDAPLQARILKITSGGLSGTLRVRVFPSLPYIENFESPELQPHPKHPDTHYAHPPAPWIGAKLKWEVREKNGNKVLRKTLDRLLFQRATTFVGTPEMHNYTVEADVMSDGSRRNMSTVGVVNQRYIIALKGNWKTLEVSSNYDRIQVSVPFQWKPKFWYRLKTRVDVAEDGSGVVRAKAWLKGEPEPESWLLEVPLKRAHRNGAPGIFGFSPQAQFPVYVDNLVVRPNE